MIPKSKSTIHNDVVLSSKYEAENSNKIWVNFKYSEAVIFQQAGKIFRAVCPLFFTSHFCITSWQTAVYLTTFQKLRQNPLLLQAFTKKCTLFSVLLLVC